MIDPYPEVGSRIGGKYIVMDIAGVGGTALVLKCKNASGKDFAVKRFYPEKVSAKLRNRIYEEVNLNLQSAYLVTSVHVFEVHNHIFSVMPFVPGKNLGDILLACDRLSPEEVCKLGIGIAEAASVLHDHGIISSDIKPDNIIITPQGELRLIDLTCFERIGNEPEISQGTSYYAAPELLARRQLTAATDIYSIAMIMLEALYGEEFLEQNGLDIAAIRNQYPRLSRIIQRATEPMPKDRYADARSFITDLNRCLNTAGSEPGCCMTLDNGKQFFIPPGKYVLGRDNIAPGNPYISARQFELEFTGSSARIRDIACKNKIFMGNITVGGTWSNIPYSSIIKIANVKLKIEVK